jgi:hypothetical protein
MDRNTLRLIQMMESIVYDIRRGRVYGNRARKITRLLENAEGWDVTAPPGWDVTTGNVEDYGEDVQLAHTMMVELKSILDKLYPGVADRTSFTSYANLGNPAGRNYDVAIPFENMSKSKPTITKERLKAEIERLARTFTLESNPDSHIARQWEEHARGQSFPTFIFGVVPIK